VFIGHLFLGTRKDNYNDASKKGRAPNIDDYRIIPSGSKNGNAKLTEESVLEIRRKYIPLEYGFVRLAREYGVDPVTIREVVKRQAWKHI